ncbi:MAG: DUF1501 domain-containing protein [Gemmataceae bacterium]
MAAESGRRRAATLPDGRLPRRRVQPAPRRHGPRQPVGGRLPLPRLRSPVGPQRRASAAPLRPDAARPPGAPLHVGGAGQPRPLPRTSPRPHHRAGRAAGLRSRSRARRHARPLRPASHRPEPSTRRLIEAGVRLVSVTAWCGTPPGERFRNVQTWDMHGDGAGLGSIFGTTAFGLGWALPNLDQAVSALLEDLEVRGLLDSTLVVMVGEFGRSPRISNAGRDHWPACYSAMLAGGGARRGLVYGASDAQGGYVKDRPVSPENFGATLFHLLGIPAETRLAADGFTRPASVGQVVEGLVG